MVQYENLPKGRNGLTLQLLAGQALEDNGKGKYLCGQNFAGQLRCTF